MARLYLFAIGGTGARVLRSLTHLLTAGVELLDDKQRPMELVPLVIDPDTDNGDTLDSLNVLALYNEIRTKSLEPGHTRGFIGTAVRRYYDLRAAGNGSTVDDELPAAFQAESFRSGIIDEARSQQFEEVIGYRQLGRQTRLLVDALYSRENLETRLSGGFLGNPNVGTVVLNRLKESPQFRMLPGLFHDEDRVFIISSIFGGTGAAGFPVLVKLLRDAKDSKGQPFQVLQRASVGALTVLPYFSLAPSPESPIDSNAFVPKTKAALTYYSEHLRGIQSLYYVADRSRREYRNTPTGKEQSNQDHLVEFVGATAVLDFARTPTADLRQDRVLECAVSRGDSFDLSSFGEDLAATVSLPVTAFCLANLFLDQVRTGRALSNCLAQPWAKEGGFTGELIAGSANASPLAPWRRLVALWRESFAQMAENDPELRAFGSGLSGLRPDLGASAQDVSFDQLHRELNRLSAGRASTREFGQPGTVRRLVRMLSAASSSVCDKHFGARAIAAD